MHNDMWLKFCESCPGRFFLVSCVVFHVAKTFLVGMTEEYWLKITS